VAGSGELVGLRTVGEHRPDLTRAGASGFEYEMAAIGSPGGTLVAPLVAGDLEQLAGSYIHDVEIVVSAGTTPTEREELAIGRPSGIDDVTHVGKINALGIGAVSIHEIELRSAGAIADKGDRLAGFRIPGGRSVGPVVGEGEALGAIAGGVGDIQSRVALHGGGEHHLGAIGGPSRSNVRAAETSEGNDFVGIEGIHADLRAGDAADGLETREGDAGGVRGPVRGDGYRAEGSEFVLIGAVVIHNPDFLRAIGIATRESDLRTGNARQAAGKLTNNFVGELMSKNAHLGVGRLAAVGLADDGLRGGTHDVEEPSVDGDVGGGFGEITEGEEVGVHGPLRPIEHTEFPGLRGCVGGIETGTGEFDDAGKGEVVADHGGEKSRVGFGVIRFGCEIGDRDARSGLPEAGAGADLILRKGGRTKKKCEKGDENGRAGGFYWQRVLL